MIGIAVITYNRPDFFRDCMEHLLKNVKSVDHVVVVNDGSDKKYKEAYKRIYDSLAHTSATVTVLENKNNRGVAYTKNRGIRALIKRGCTHLFTLEDDILILDDKAVTGYIQASEKSGFKHLMYAWHGPANKTGPNYKDDTISYFKHGVGAWCYYHKDAILGLKEIEKGYEYAGFMDEKMINANEHLHHTQRLGDNGFTSPFWMFADATGSDKWLKEIPESIEKSSIRSRKDWEKNIGESIERWVSLDGRGLPEFPS